MLFAFDPDPPADGHVRSSPTPGCRASKCPVAWIADHAACSAVTVNPFRANVAGGWVSACSTTATRTASDQSTVDSTHSGWVSAIVCERPFSRGFPAVSAAGFLPFQRQESGHWVVWERGWRLVCSLDSC